MIASSGYAHTATENKSRKGYFREEWHEREVVVDEFGKEAKAPNTEPSAVAPDARFKFRVEQVADRVNWVVTIHP
jgi:hypothetical protein